MPIILPASSPITVDDPLVGTGLIRELGYRLGDLFLSNPTSGGTATTLIDTALNQFIPQDVAQINVWAYGAENVVAANSGYERRAKSWAKDASTLTFFAPGFPAAVTAEGTYEIHTRTRRERKLRAINAAVSQLYLYWFREVMDESIVSAAFNWRYDLPTTVNWANIYKVEVQATTNTQLVGYPFIDGREFDWRVETDVDADGTRTTWLRFGFMPPPGRTIRVWGQAYASQIVNDTDRLALDGKWSGAALEWIFDYAEYLINKWESNRQPAGQSDRYRIMSLDRLNSMKDDLLRSAPSHKPSPIIVPGRGDALAYPRYAGAEWLGAFGNQH